MLSLPAHRAVEGAQPVLVLTPAKARLLAMLIEAQGRVVSVADLQAARPIPRTADPDGAKLRRIVFDTRQLLHAAGLHGVIFTVYGAGYHVPPAAAARVQKVLAP